MFGEGFGGRLALTNNHGLELAAMRLRGLLVKVCGVLSMCVHAPHIDWAGAIED